MIRKSERKDYKEDNSIKKSQSSNRTGKDKFIQSRYMTFKGQLIEGFNLLKRINKVDYTIWLSIFKLQYQILNLSLNICKQINVATSFLQNFKRQE